MTRDEIYNILDDAEEIVSLAEVQENYDSTYTYANGVIEVPSEIGFEISPNETVVTLYSEDLPIEVGDDFVVYMDSLPIAYRALEISIESGSTTIIVEKAAPSVYGYVDEQGIIALTADNAEFIPDEGVAPLSADGFDFSNGKLYLSTSVGDSKVEVYLEDLSLNHSFSDDSITVTVNGSWGLTTTLALKEEIGPEMANKQMYFGKCNSAWAIKTDCVRRLYDYGGM